LAHDVADCGSYSGVEENASSLQSGKIHAHGLSRLKGSHNSPRVKLCACFPPIANQLAVGILVGQPLLAVPARLGESVRDSQEWLSYCKLPCIVT